MDCEFFIGSRENRTSKVSEPDGLYYLTDLFIRYNSKLTNRRDRRLVQYSSQLELGSCSLLILIKILSAENDSQF